MRTKNGPASAAIDNLIAASPLKGMEMDEGGEAACILFADYMRTCLYDPIVGYYRSGATRVGKDGDFYTSSAVGDLMARSIAASIIKWRGNAPNEDERPLIAEWGAGTGRLSAQLANVLGEDEINAGSIAFKQLLIEDHDGHLAAIADSYREAGILRQPAVRTSEEVWANDDTWFSGPSFIIANELLDAFPVHRIMRRGGELWELGVAGSLQNGFRYVRLPLRDIRLTDAMKTGEIKLAEGQVAEVGLDAIDWIGRLGQALSGGRVLLIDYGDEGEELSGPHRMAGTLMTYRGHQASDSPFDQPGARDLTAHVNFTAIRRKAESCGFRTVYYATQKQFLVDHGMLGLLAGHDGSDPFSPVSRRNRAIRQLLLSDGMSESFKVLLLEK